MKTIITAVAITVLLSGCAATDKLVSMVPSFWDDNQSAKITDVRQGIEQITCEPGTQAQDAEYILTEVQWFQLYSESKGTRQQDVLRIIAPMKETLEDWLKRSQTKEGSPAYCAAKKKILQGQSRRAAESILGRF